MLATQNDGFGSTHPLPPEVIDVVDQDDGIVDNHPYQMMRPRLLVLSSGWLCLEQKNAKRKVNSHKPLCELEALYLKAAPTFVQDCSHQSYQTPWL